MAQNRIEETFRAIAHSRKRGIPDAPPLTAGVADGGGLSGSFSQAANEISQLRASYQQQADLIKANTQAIQNNTSGLGNHASGSSLGGAVGSIFGGALGLFSPIVSGLTHLFGGLFGGQSQPSQLPVYTAPPPVSIGGILYSQNAAAASVTNTTDTRASAGAAAAPQITVNVSAMDSQSFMDRSADIASAVREAMLNNHPINGVVADL